MAHLPYFAKGCREHWIVESEILRYCSIDTRALTRTLLPLLTILGNFSVVKKCCPLYHMRNVSDQESNLGRSTNPSVFSGFSPDFQRHFWSSPESPEIFLQFSISIKPALKGLITQIKGGRFWPPPLSGDMAPCHSTLLWYDPANMTTNLLTSDPQLP
jgi:hypothetical protein